MKFLLKINDHLHRVLKADCNKNTRNPKILKNGSDLALGQLNDIIIYNETLFFIEMNSMNFFIQIALNLH